MSNSELSINELDNMNLAPNEQSELSQELINQEHSELVDEDQDSVFQKVRSHLARRKWRYLGGVAAASAALTFTNNPMSEIKDNVIEAAPYVATGVVASEAAFCIGGIMMVGAVGDKIGNPLKIKNRLPEIAAKAQESKLFKAGFIINTVGAVGDFAVISTGVVDKMPVESYGVLSLTLGDLALTMAVRKGILDSVNENAQKHVEFEHVSDVE